MIKIKNLTKVFSGDVFAVNNLTIDIEKGVIGLVGENGAGKSTLLRCIADVYDKTSGTINVDGFDNSTTEARKLIFFLSDNPFCSPHGNAKDTMEFYSSLFDLDKDKFYFLLSKLSLPNDRRISTFSKGMRRQLFLCIALSVKAKYVFLDEAFDGLDPIIQDVVKDEIIVSSNEKTFVVSSHNLLSLQKLCDTFIVLSKGKCSGKGKAEDIGNNYIKYQILFNEDVKEQDLRDLGVSLISYKKVGSIVSVITTNEDDEKLIKEKYNPYLIENVVIDSDEILKLEILINKEGGQK